MVLALVFFLWFKTVCINAPQMKIYGKLQHINCIYIWLLKHSIFSSYRVTWFLMCWPPDNDFCHIRPQLWWVFQCSMLVSCFSPEFEVTIYVLRDSSIAMPQIQGYHTYPTLGMYFYYYNSHYILLALIIKYNIPYVFALIING